MPDSNYTLRFNRTSREAYGHSIELGEPRHLGDHVVGIGAAFVAGFLLAILIIQHPGENDASQSACQSVHAEAP